MKSLMSLFILVFLLSISNSCFYDVQEDLISNTSCDTLSITFTQDIVPILEARCYECHSNNTHISRGDGIDLEGYDDLISMVNSGKFWGSINHENGYSPMPKELNKLSECQLTKIGVWIDDGAPNN